MYFMSPIVEPLKCRLIWRVVKSLLPFGMEIVRVYVILIKICSIFYNRIQFLRAVLFGLYLAICSVSTFPLALQTCKMNTLLILKYPNLSTLSFSLYRFWKFIFGKDVYTHRLIRGCLYRELLHLIIQTEVKRSSSTLQSPSPSKIYALNFLWNQHKHTVSVS